MTDEITKQNCVLIPCKTLAIMLSISPRTAWRLLSANKLPKPISLGGSKRFLRSDIDLFLGCGCDMATFKERKEVENAK